MGVKGLWKILKTAGQPVPIQSLRGKRLAIDASIWLYQFLNGYKDSTGSAVPFAHILGFLKRLARLLFHGIKPVFVFDGGAPRLKAETLKERKVKVRDQEARHKKLADKILKAKLQLNALEEPEAVEEFVEDFVVWEDSESEESDIEQTEGFQNLPPINQQEILLEMRQRRKEFTDPALFVPDLPALNFSQIQIQNVKNRNSATMALEKFRKQNSISRKVAMTQKEFIFTKKEDQKFELTKSDHGGWSFGLAAADKTERVTEHSTEDLDEEPVFTDNDKLPEIAQQQSHEMPSTERQSSNVEKILYERALRTESSVDLNMKLATDNMLAYPEPKAISSFTAREEFTEIAHTEFDVSQSLEFNIPDSVDLSAVDKWARDVKTPMVDFGILRPAPTQSVKSAGPSSVEDTLEKAAILRDLEKLKSENRIETFKTPDSEVSTDIQELLRLFGIPFIIAPMEAEAECAFLEENDLVDGIVTDDSDAFLFGGSKVYRNLFSSTANLELYSVRNIKTQIGLERSDLIDLAFLLGSDYTKGVTGIGPVAAVEVIAALKNIDSNFLVAFSKWKAGCLAEKIENLRSKIEIGYNFDPAVVDAYMNPMIDLSQTELTWTLPNFSKIESFLKTNLQWDDRKIQEYIHPIKKGDSSERQSVQMNLAQNAPTSKRLNEAISSLKRFKRELKIERSRI